MVFLFPKSSVEVCIVGLYFCISHYHDVYCCSHTNDAEQFFERMEQKDADTYSALMVGLYKVCVT